MDLQLKNKTVLVTAGSKGIGKAVALALAAEGCRLAVTSSSKENLKKFSEECKAKTGQTPYMAVMDLNNPSEAAEVTQKIVKEFGSIEILVNNCGGPQAGRFLELTDKQWESGVNQILISVIAILRLLIPPMREKKWGRIINITSVSVRQPIDNLVISNAVRAGLTGLAKSLSNEYAADGLTINNIAPGYTLTERIKDLSQSKATLTGNSPDDIIREMTQNIPAGRMAHPEEPAALACFLASPLAGYINGNTIQIDGGYTKSLL
ncbi:MAG: SDR family oxidoreductase [Ignavibacteriaceae bacterium]|nr:SDR family oxidoreductase [Ignavibacteriaceae bacterium]